MRDGLSISPEQQRGEPDKESTDWCDGFFQQWQIDAVWQSWHKQILKRTEMCALPHFFSKYAGWIDSNRDMLNIDSFIFHPYPNQISLSSMWCAALEVILYDHLMQA